jgi:putative DNA-invertase from lambdoid prophage Rac
MIYGYYRVSTDDQTCESQRLNVLEFANNRNLTINREYFDNGVSGAVSVKERQLYNIIKHAQKGDILIVSELSRIGRSTFDVLETIHSLNKKGVDIYLVKQNLLIDQSPMGKLMVAIMAAFSEMERDLMIQRTKDGIRRAQMEGKKIGRPKGSFSRKLASKTEEVKKMARQMNISQLARYFKCDWNTIHRFMHEQNIPHNRLKEITFYESKEEE